MRTLAPLTILLMLAACDSQKGDGTTIAIHDESGNQVIGSDGKDGKVAIDLPGVQARIDLPKIRLDAEDFDIDGVKLYPGSTIGKIDIRDDTLKVAFTAPGAAQAVQSYFLTAFKDKGMKVWSRPDGVAGRDDEDRPFVITLAGAGTRTEGKIFMDGKS